MKTERLPEDTEFGPYVVKGLIGRGGMGQVYAARDSVYGTMVALKVLHPNLHEDEDWRSRFNEEGLVGTQLKHPHVLSARELLESEGRIALVLDLVSGGQTLDKVMFREHRSGVPLVPALLVFLRILQGIDYLHGKGIVHGDIKPENILLEGDYRVPGTWVPKVTDFGTVALIAHPVEIDGRPAVVATPRYASPEHLLGVDRLEFRSDVYCLGLILHFILTGRHASNAANVREAAERTMLPVPILALVDQPDGVIDAFKRATHRDPEHRFANVREFALAVRELLEAQGAPLELEDISAELATEIDERRQGDARAREDSEVKEHTPTGFSPIVSPGGVQPLAPKLNEPEPEPSHTNLPPRPISAAAMAPQQGPSTIPSYVWVAGLVAVMLIGLAIYAST